MVYYPDRLAPRLPKDKYSSLRYHPVNDSWLVDVDGTTVGEYKHSELRISIVYRARCFSSEQEASEYRTRTTRRDLDIPLEDILSILAKDLIVKGKLSEEQYKTISKLDFAFLLLKSYTAYPLPLYEQAKIPLNYCALPKLFPSLTSLMSLVC